MKFLVVKLVLLCAVCLGASPLYSFDIKSSVPAGTTVICGFDLAKGK